MPSVQPSDLLPVRESYDRVADVYVELGVGRLEEVPWLRAALAAFAESVRGLGPVLDVGCGPGTITAHLTELGLDAAGVDLSPRMVEHARRLYPDLRFSVASATELDLAPASLGGVLGWWSLFNLPREELPGVLKTFAEALVPGGQALVGTHVGDGDVPRTKGYGGLPVSWTTHLYRPEELAGMLADAGLELIADLRMPAQPPQRPQVLLAARRPALPEASGE
ncbi:methyltransferase domain-containing protein [Amycolatopsis carbonis]|uniref:Methyltransferase domain-containing protein n=1 Tax=Amycolatopsis carbonis TaxID=715471 RepID=A0A9Y2IN74_9PSEU|nr:class I SAM-dependent methyltransferase [Amycolatopsis sp. 2-15]WIX83212.1 methyltransferase domain-containing protein [Amycolatopsis sp. 2-15]